MSNEIWSLFLDNAERAAKGEEANFGNMPFAHPHDTLKLIAEIRRLRAQVAELTEAALVSDPRNDEEPTP